MAGTSEGFEAEDGVGMMTGILLRVPSYKYTVTYPNTPWGVRMFAEVQGFRT